MRFCLLSKLHCFMSLKHSKRKALGHDLSRLFERCKSVQSKCVNFLFNKEVQGARLSLDSMTYLTIILILTPSFFAHWLLPPVDLFVYDSVVQHLGEVVTSSRFFRLSHYPVHWTVSLQLTQRQSLL